MKAGLQTLNLGLKIIAAITVTIFLLNLYRMETGIIQVLVADDNWDDCLLFKEALSELPLKTQLTTVEDGFRLLERLTQNTSNLPDILFLDLNMPRQNGYECLLEIKANKQLQNIPVIIFSTSLEQHIVNLLYENGANLYIKKPNDFTLLKKVIADAISTQVNTVSTTV